MSNTTLDHTPSPELQAAADSWQDATLAIVNSAASVADLTVDGIDAFILDSDAVDETRALLTFSNPEGAFEEQVGDLIARSEATIDAVAGDSGSAQEAASRSIAVLTGNLNTGYLLLAAAEEPSLSLAAFGRTSRGVDDPTDDTAYLDELKYILFGTPLPGPEVPSSVKDELEKLEVAGGDEFRGLAGSTVMWAVLGTSVKGLEDLDKSGIVAKAFDEVREAVHWLRRGALKLIQWTLARLQNLVPERFRDRFDEKVDQVKDHFKESAEDVFNNAVGSVFGRLGADRAWQVAIGAGLDVTAETERVGPAVATHLNRIAWVSTARKAADGAVAFILSIIAKLANLTGPWASVIVGALALAVFALVGYQLWDGFNDVEGLAPTP
ncbi:hypothetical protein GCM10023350_49560 [Nocardioides endophyticus]|uniref:Uncharacterized protein n=1 Tax=Nocardioides endophyticus TaxID=1353775 RepID=A0ABP8ZJK5_9ACTN